MEALQKENGCVDATRGGTSPKLARFVLWILFSSGCITPAIAQDYPTRSVTLVVPIGAGGPLDTTARLLATKLAELDG